MCCFPGGSILGTLGKILLGIAKIPGVSHLLEDPTWARGCSSGWPAPPCCHFPDYIGWSTGAAGTVLMIRSVGKLLATVLSLAKRVFDWALAWTGLTDTEDEIGIPESDLIEFYHSLLDTFNRGSVLQRANLYTYSNGYAMLSSVQCHQSGLISAQTAVDGHSRLRCLGVDHMSLAGEGLICNVVSPGHDRQPAGRRPFSSKTSSSPTAPCSASPDRYCRTSSATTDLTIGRALLPCQWWSSTRTWQ